MSGTEASNGDLLRQVQRIEARPGELAAATRPREPQGNVPPTADPRATTSTGTP